MVTVNSVSVPPVKTSKLFELSRDGVLEGVNESGMKDRLRIARTLQKVRDGLLVLREVS
jgi:hypothetical protein